MNETNGESAEITSRGVIHITAGGSRSQYWRDLWSFRELLYILAWRDILVRYKQTVMGVAWAVVRPLLTMAILTIVFGKLAKMPSDGTPYPLLVFCGLLPWQFFSSAVSEGGNSLVRNANMVSKVYFPRLLVPTSSVVTSVVDFLISFVLFVLMMFYYRHMPEPEVLMIPVFVGIALAFALGVSYLVSALMVRYRDVRIVIPFVVQFGLYVSPVPFVSSVVPEQWRLLYNLNPMVGVIDGFRWALLGGEHKLFLPGLFMSLSIVAITLVAGFFYFRKTERVFADVI